MIKKKIVEDYKNKIRLLKNTVIYILMRIILLF